MNKDYEKIFKINYEKINIVDNINSMIDSVTISHTKIIDRRIKAALKKVLNKSDYDKAIELMKTKNKPVINFFLLEKNIQMKLNQVQEKNTNLIYFYLDLVYTPPMKKNEQKIRLSYISEEDFKQQLKDLNDLK